MMFVGAFVGVGHVLAQDQAQEMHTVTDMYGRQVEIPKEIKSVVSIGGTATRMVVYMNKTDMIVGIDKNNHDYNLPTRDFAYVNHDKFKELAIVGEGGNSSIYSAYPEEIIKVNPDIIISGFSSEQMIDQLQEETGIPTIGLTHSAGFFEEDFFETLDLLGQIFDDQERATELTEYIHQAQEDLSSRVKDIAEEDRPKVYVGGVNWKGAHGFTGTSANFGPFVALNINNLADTLQDTGFIELDFEKIIEWAPDYIFVEPQNMDLIQSEYQTKPDAFEALEAIQEDRLYSFPSYINNNINFTYSLIGAYYAGQVIYPEEFSDIDLETKANEIMEMFLGVGYFEELEKNNMKYGKTSINE